MGWRMRRGVDLGTGTLLVIGGVAAIVGRAAYDLVAHHHSIRRSERG